VEKGKGEKGPELWRGEGEKWFLLSTMAGADGDAAGVAGVEMACQIGNPFKKTETAWPHRA